MGDVRNGYNDPASATTQGEKYGAWVRQQEEQRASARAAQAGGSSSHPPISMGESLAKSGPDASARAGATSSGDASPKASGQAGAWLGALVALYLAYKPHTAWMVLGLFAAVGAGLGYVGGWVLHWVVVIAVKILAVAVKVAAFLFLAWLALQIVPVFLK